MQGPSPFHMEVQCRAHLQFTWRSSAGPISSSHGGPVQGRSPVYMEVQCRAYLQFTCVVLFYFVHIYSCAVGGGGGGGGGGRGLKTSVWWATITLWQQWDITT